MTDAGPKAKRIIQNHRAEYPLKGYMKRTIKLERVTRVGKNHATDFNSVEALKATIIANNNVIIGRMNIKNNSSPLIIFTSYFNTLYIKECK